MHACMLCFPLLRPHSDWPHNFQNKLLSRMEFYINRKSYLFYINAIGLDVLMPLKFSPKCKDFLSNGFANSECRKTKKTVEVLVLKYLIPFGFMQRIYSFLTITLMFTTLHLSSCTSIESRIKKIYGLASPH